MIHYDHTFSTEEQARDFMDGQLSRFHPDGYGTALFLTPTEDGRFRVTGSRYSSCD